MDPITYPFGSPEWWQQKQVAQQQKQDVPVSDWLYSLGQIAQYGAMGRGGVGKWQGGVPKEQAGTRFNEEAWQKLMELISKDKRDQWLAEIAKRNPKAAEAILKRRAEPQALHLPDNRFPQDASDIPTLWNTPRVQKIRQSATSGSIHGMVDAVEQDMLDLPQADTPLYPMTLRKPQ
jgi:hypothetical protein